TKANLKASEEPKDCTQWKDGVTAAQRHVDSSKDAMERAMRLTTLANEYSYFADCEKSAGRREAALDAMAQAVARMNESCAIDPGLGGRTAHRQICAADLPKLMEKQGKWKKEQ